jgi:23S rRNA (uracil1939-C5)-methyltransferase
MYRKGDILVVKIENLAFGGPGVARIESGVDAEGRPRRLVIFVEGVVPGDEVEIQLFEVKRGLGRGRVKKFLKYSADRVEPRCKHFGMGVDNSGEVLPLLSVPRSDGILGPDVLRNCGGCSWQFLPYEKQLEVKEAEVRSSLIRIGGLSEELLLRVMRPIIAAENPWHYRNKMDFSFVRESDRRLHLGLHMKGRFNDLTEITECHLFRPWIGEFLEAVRPFFESLVLEEGAELMSLAVRNGSNTGETMVNLVVENCVADFADRFSELMRAQNYGDDKLVSVFLTQITNKKGQPKRFEEKLLWGKPVFREILKLTDGQVLNFEVAPQAFLQPNTKQAEKFYSLVGELAELSGEEKVFDVFCGTGTIGLTLAARAGRVVGLELNASAVENARQNAELNQIVNAEFIAGDANKILPELGSEVDLIVVDPPRAGLGQKIIHTISATAAKRVIYVSCNPSTLARDLKDFRAAGWEVDFVQAIDQFSQTYHVETVVRMGR